MSILDARKVGLFSCFLLTKNEAVCIDLNDSGHVREPGSRSKIHQNSFSDSRFVFFGENLNVIFFFWGWLSTQKLSMEFYNWPPVVTLIRRDWERGVQVPLRAVTSHPEVFKGVQGKKNT